jgi:hypothetical protein
LLKLLKRHLKPVLDGFKSFFYCFIAHFRQLFS